MGEIMKKLFTLVTSLFFAISVIFCLQAKDDQEVIDCQHHSLSSIQMH